MEKKTVLTGIRPTGNLHLGHYFGACSNWLKMQDEYDFYLEIADVQALTDNLIIRIRFVLMYLKSLKIFYR